MAEHELARWRGANPGAPDGLLEAFLRYEAALTADDLTALDELFADSPGTLRGDAAGLLVGAATISGFRAARGGAPARRLTDVRVIELGPDAAAVVAVTAPARGGRGLQTQVWQRTSGAWRVSAAHVSAPPVTFDAAVWRVVGDPLLPATATGPDQPLAGESVAVKDLFAVTGHPVGAGVPEFLAGSQPETADSATVAALRAAGAAVRGIARTDQFAYSLAGDNPHYGTPVNPVAPGALPGGSSSGSAVAVALGAASIGLGTDTGGSIRVPASYSGLWGWRPTHGRVSTAGLLPLAPDFDTVDLLTRDPRLLARAAPVLLATAGGSSGPEAANAADESLDRLVAATVLPSLEPGVAEAFAALLVTLPATTVELPDLAAAAEAFRVHQGFQAWQRHGAWLTGHPGAVRGAVAQRFAAASAIRPEQDERARSTLAAVRAELDDVLADAVLVLPSAAGPAPKLWASAAQIDAHRRATLALTCIAGITGRPAVSAPLIDTPDGPLGVCLIGPRGSDQALIARAGRLTSVR